MDARLEAAIAEILEPCGSLSRDYNYWCNRAADILHRHMAEPSPFVVLLEALVQEWGNMDGASYMVCSHELHKLLAEHAPHEVAENENSSKSEN